MMDFSSLEQQNGLPPGILNAVMNQESGGNPNAVSPAGAVGAFQFMPATAQQYGIDPTDPNQSAQAAATMLGQLNQKYQGSIPHVLAGYNWGQGNVDRQGLQNAPPETQNYIQSVMGKLGNAIVPSAQAADTPTQMPNQSAPSMPVQNGTFDVTMPDGTTIKGVPQGTTQSQLQAKLSKMTNSPMQDNSPQPLQPDNFMERLGMASTGDTNQQTEAARQAGMYSQAALTGLGSIPDIPGSLIATVPAAGKFLGSQFQQGPQPSFVEDLQNEINKSNLTPQLGQKFNQWANQQTSNGFIPQNNGEKTAVAGIQGVAMGLPFGPVGALAGGAGNSVNQIALNNGLSPDQSAILGLLTGGAMTKAPEVMESLDQNLGQTIRPTANDLKATSQASYADAATKGGVLSPQFTNNFLDKIGSFGPQDPMAADIIGESPSMNLLGSKATQDEEATGLEKYRDQPMTLDRATAVDQALSKLLDNPSMTDKNGILNANGREVLQIKNHLSDSLGNAVDNGQVQGGSEGVNAYQNAVKDWAAKSQMNDIENIINKAQYMDNPATSLKAGFRTIAVNPGRLGRFPVNVQNAIKSAATDGNLTGLMRTELGSRLISSMIGAVGGSSMGPLGSLAGGIGGMIMSGGARNLAETMKMNAANNVMDNIAANSSLPTTNIPLSEMIKQRMGAQ